MKIIFKSMVVTTFLVFAFATARAQEEIYKLRAFSGYTYLNLNRWLERDKFKDDLNEYPGNHVKAYGFNSPTFYNFSGFAGAKFDLSLHSYCGKDFTSTITNPLALAPYPGAFEISQSVYRYTNGIQIEDNKKDASGVKTFDSRLFGITDRQFSINRIHPIDSRLVNINSSDFFAKKLGRSVDLQPARNIDLRLIQKYDLKRIVEGDLNLREDPALTTGARRITGCSSAALQFIKQGIGRMESEKSSRLFENP
jgi:hypothetical protein